jgi:hypothetical protein
VISFPESGMSVWHAPQLFALTPDGVAVVVLGVFLPARLAAYLSVAGVLHNELSAGTVHGYSVDGPAGSRLPTLTSPVS